MATKKEGKMHELDLKRALCAGKRLTELYYVQRTAAVAGHDSNFYRWYQHLSVETKRRFFVVVYIRVCMYINDHIVWPFLKKEKSKEVP